MELAGSGVFILFPVVGYLKGVGLWLQICEKIIESVNYSLPVGILSIGHSYYRCLVEKGLEGALALALEGFTILNFGRFDSALSRLGQRCAQDPLEIAKGLWKRENSNGKAAFLARYPNLTLLQHLVSSNSAATHS